MTGPEDAARDEGRPDPLETATEDLARIRELLIAAGRGEADAADVGASLKRYLEAHRPALQEAAVSLGEEVRLQTLAELYRWRAELDAQLKPRGPDEDDRADSSTTSP